MGYGVQLSVPRGVGVRGTGYGLSVGARRRSTGYGVWGTVELQWSTGVRRTGSYTIRESSSFFLKRSAQDQTRGTTAELGYTWSTGYGVRGTGVQGASSEYMGYGVRGTAAELAVDGVRSTGYGGRAGRTRSTGYGVQRPAYPVHGAHNMHL